MSIFMLMLLKCVPFQSQICQITADLPNAFAFTTIPETTNEKKKKAVACVIK